MQIRYRCSYQILNLNYLQCLPELVTMLAPEKRAMRRLVDVLVNVTPCVAQDKLSEAQRGIALLQGGQPFHIYSTDGEGLFRCCFASFSAQFRRI